MVHNQAYASEFLNTLAGILADLVLGLLKPYEARYHSLKNQVEKVWDLEKNRIYCLEVDQSAYNIRPRSVTYGYTIINGTERDPVPDKDVQKPYFYLELRSLNLTILD